MKIISLQIVALLVALTGSINILWGQQEPVDKSLSPYFQINSDNPGIDQLPLKSTKAEVNIAGVIADVVITQEYRNDGPNPIEAIYVFPASTRAAVYAMEMKIGDRIIQAKIKEKGQARAAYEQAKSEGKRTSLLEQSRPNVFQMNVANILPGDNVSVVLKYTESLGPEAGKYSFVYPTVVGPRYTGGVDATASTDNDFLATPYTKAGTLPSYDFDIKVHLAAGMPIQEITSNTHSVNVNYNELSTANILLDNSGRQGGNRDFVLDYRLAGNEIASGLLLYEHKDENFFMLTVQPPKRVTNEDIPAREYIFVVDVSGSMRGFPLTVSKKLLRDLMVGMRTTDMFNVMFFAGSAYVLSPESLHATPENIDYAIRTLNGNNGGGGTNLLPALKSAIDLPRCSENLSRSIVIATDGYIAVEEAVFDLIRKNSNKANFFSFGIGSSVNRLLIEGMAHVGMGEPLVIKNKAEAPAKAEKFRQYISTPVLTQIELDFGDLDVYDVEPLTVPDVLAERPITVFGKYKGKAKGQIKVKGYSGEKKFEARYDVRDAKANDKNSAIRYLWAREKIRLLDDYNNLRKSDARVKEVTNLGLKYNLLTAYTSFIAVDETPVLAANQKSRPVKQVLPMPQGVPNSAIGFDLEIEGVVRSKAKQLSVSIGAIELEMEANKMANLLAELQVKIESLITCYKEMMKSGPATEKITLRITVDKNGKIKAVKILSKTGHEKALKCLRDGMENWTINGVDFKNACSFEVPVVLNY